MVDRFDLYEGPAKGIYSGVDAFTKFMKKYGGAENVTYSSKTENGAHFLHYHLHNEGVTLLFVCREVKEGLVSKVSLYGKNNREAGARIGNGVIKIEKAEEKVKAAQSELESLTF